MNNGIRTQYSDKKTIGEAPLVGKTVAAAFISEDKEDIRLDMVSGETYYLRTDADCCSETWIEHVNNFDTLIGKEIVGTETKDLGEGIATRQDRDLLYSASILYKVHNYHGSADIEFRNSSNGYYGGDIFLTTAYVREIVWIPLTKDF